jgi:hypothetical protein
VFRFLNRESIVGGDLVLLLDPESGSILEGTLVYGSFIDQGP